MYSSIFQISAEPITEENYIKESRYNEFELGYQHMDYVVKSESREDDIRWLRDIKGLEVTEDTITVVSKKEYFEESFKNFQEFVKKFNNYTIDDFIEPGKSKLDFIDLRDAYDDKMDFKVDDNDEYFGLVSLDEFVRNAEEGKVYYIGKTFDYHF